MSDSKLSVNYGFIQDTFFRMYNEDIRSRVKDQYESLVEELESSNTMKANSLPRGDQYAIRGILMRGVVEPAFVRQIELPTSVIRKWAQAKIEIMKDSLYEQEGQLEAAVIASTFSVADDLPQIINGIKVKWDTKDFQRILEIQAGINLSNRISPRFSDTLVFKLKHIAQTAAAKALAENRKTLIRVATERAEQHTERLFEDVRRSASYLDTTGAIIFHEHENRLSIERGHINPKKANYRELLNRTVLRIQNDDLLNRIDNYDSKVVGYVKEYIAEFALSVSGEDAMMLTSIANLLSKQIEFNQNNAPVDERIDRSSIIILEQLLVEHSLYMQSFSVMEDVLRDSERALDFYRNIDGPARNLPWNTLNRIVQTEAILEDRSQAALARLSAAILESSEGQKKSIIVIGMGALRGSLQAMAGTVLENGNPEKGKSTPSMKSGLAAELGKEALKETVKEGVKSAFHNQALHDNIIQFFSSNVSYLVDLADAAPAYFSWVKLFISLVTYTKP